MARNELFIKTTDKETADKLKQEGFELVSEQAGVYCFLNNSSLSFSEAGHVAFSNALSV